MDKKIGLDKVKYIDFFSMGLLGVVCFCYAIFNSDFAELHIKLPFLDFPIFIGEIFLGIFIILTAIKLKSTPTRLKGWHYLLFIYIGFILVKSFYGYFKWGPLAFRNAALFYYPLFAIVAYYIFDKNFFKNKLVLYLAPVLLIGGLLFRLASDYYYFNFFIFLLIFLLLVGNRIIKYIFVFCLVAIFLYLLSFIQVRGILLGSFLSGLFLFFIYCFCLLRVRLGYRLIYFVSLILLLAIGFWIFGDQSAILATFPNDKDIEFYQKISKEDKGLVSLETESGQIKTYEANSEYQEKLEFLKRTRKSKTNREYYRIDKNNMLWRLFVWSDMLEELAESNKIFGLDFGKPFRSKTIEFLGWQDADWVGWIEPHNSYIHILYRLGIIGLFLIIVMAYVFIRLVSGFVMMRDTKGILLCSVLLFWFVVANFEVVLELPYFAIPFWSLFGMTKAYQKSILVSSDLKSKILGG